MSVLKHSFLQVETKREKSFGGNQNWFPYKFLKKSGCGVISAANVLMHLRGKRQVSELEYLDFAKYMWKYYLPVIPGFGMNGLTLMMGLNRYFLKKKLPYKAGWKISGKKLLSRIDEMLTQDIPVILSVGPNFPKFWGKEQLSFYKRTEDGKYLAAVKTRAHYVTVTGREGQWLQISSWGKEYYMNLREYQNYVKTYSSYLVSNIICITQKKKIQ